MNTYIQQYDFPTKISQIKADDIVIPRRFAVIRTDTNEPLGIISDKYQLVPHKLVIDSFRQALAREKMDFDEKILLSDNGAYLNAKYNFPERKVEIRLNIGSNLPIDYAAVSVVDVYGGGSIDTLAESLKDLGITPIQSAVIAMNLGVDIDDFLSTAGFTEQEILVAKEVVTQYEVVYFVAEGMSYSRIDDSVIKSNLDAAGVESDIVVLAIKNIDLDLSIVVAGTGIGLNIAQGMDLQNVINTNSFSKKAFAPEDESLWDRIKDFFMDAYSAL